MLESRFVWSSCCARARQCHIYITDVRYTFTYVKKCCYDYKLGLMLPNPKWYLKIMFPVFYVTGRYVNLKLERLLSAFLQIDLQHIYSGSQVV